MNTKRLYHMLPVVLAAAVLTALAYYPVFVRGGWAVNGSDALNLHLPRNAYLAEAVRGNASLLWNNRVNLGQPVIDGTATILHPALPLYLAFSPWAAHTVEVMLGLFFALIGAWLFLRQQRFGPLGSFAATLAYVFCGPVFFLHSYHLGLLAIVLLPWTLIAMRAFDACQRVRWLWCTAFLCVCAAQGLDADTLFYFFCGLALDRLANLPRQGRRFYLATWAGVFFLSGLTGAAWYLPLCEWLANSSRMLRSYAGVLTPDALNTLGAVVTGRWAGPGPMMSFTSTSGPYSSGSCAPGSPGSVSPRSRAVFSHTPWVSRSSIP